MQAYCFFRIVYLYNREHASALFKKAELLQACSNG